MAVRAGMPERTGVINAVEPRRSLEDFGCLGMLLIAISGARRQGGGKTRPLALINGEPTRTCFPPTINAAICRRNRLGLVCGWPQCPGARHQRLGNHHARIHRMHL